uniref:Uncharacterized protein n=1 Tax=Biomphalaria glabrata TaxID=6526 RepID=A0A2C9LYM1_BIOGL
MVLVMELILPVILLSLVTVMRLGSLPSKNQECHYQKWSMPSAGVVPFLQSYVCNIDNYCFNDVDSLKSVEVSAKSFSALTQDVLPLISSDDTLQILTVSNKSSGLLNLFKNVIEDKQLLFDIGELHF